MTPYLAQATAEPTGGLAGWAVDMIDSLGGLGIALISALDNMLSIVPADLVMPLVGYSATQGVIHIGAWPLPGPPRDRSWARSSCTPSGRGSDARVRTLLVKIPGFKAETVDRTEAWFARHGGKAVMFGRMLPGIRTLISVPAGVERMPLPKFVLFTTIGSLMWNSTLIGAGYLLGDNWHRMTDVVGHLPYVMAVLLVLAGVRFVVRRRSQRRVQQTQTAAMDTDSERSGVK
ncbi:DedA family protein [Streptomyces sporangiiformans]|uniref:DedA family protein n=1 Tax=Streptomyces sporangiiformans TaxID=2315329 RepID=UPI001F09EEFC|nr:DedA family protein [Streptomyces sporangiiformans]